MLTKYLQKKLNHIFAQLDLANGHMNLNELDGLMHAIVITPDIIQPSEWIPKIFNDQMPEYNSISQANSTLEVLMDSYAHYNAIRLKGTLSYTYDVKQLDVEQFYDILDWVGGFLTGLDLRKPIWANPIVSKELKLEEDPVTNSVDAIRALVSEEEGAIHIVKKIRKSYEEEHGVYMSEDEWNIRINADLLMMLPEAVSVLQLFGEGMDNRRKLQLDKTETVRSNKIGRNEPCPCGSGVKYKKCCALVGEKGYLH